MQCNKILLYISTLDWELLDLRYGQTAMRLTGRRGLLAAVAVTVFVLLAMLFQTFLPSPLPKPEPYMGPLPSATPPKEVAVFALVTGAHPCIAAYGYRGGSLFDRREFSMAGTLVRHP